MNCGIRESGDSRVHLAAGSRTLVRCRGCGLLYVPDFKEVSYEGEEYFTRDTLSRLVEAMGFGVLRLEAKENHTVAGWGPKEMLRRAINALSVLTYRSEAMLLFAAKAGGGNP